MSGTQEKSKLECAQSAIAHIGIKRRCSICKIKKDLNNFCSDKTRLYGKNYICRSCAKNKINLVAQTKRAKEYYVKNKDKIKEKTKKWRIDNPTKVVEFHKKFRIKHPDHKQKWRKNNPDKHKMASARQRKNRLSTDRGRFYNNFSVAIKQSINRGTKKNRKWAEIVGYDVTTLKEHLKKQFKDGMSWGNYGLWHIDHIIPQSVFNFTSPEDIDFKKCWALSNLQPMWAKENIIKSNKLNKPFQPSLLIGV